MVDTSSWCDPAKQAEAAKSLLDQGVDVITQHQDCTKTIIEATEAAGAYTVGYHADASSLAPKGWITGSRVELGRRCTPTSCRRSIDGELHRQRVQRATTGSGCKTGDNPFVQSPFGPMVTDDVQELDRRRPGEDHDGGSPFAGPVDGPGRQGAGRRTGTIPDYTTIESINYFVEGVVGKIPSS